MIRRLRGLIRPSRISTGRRTTPSVPRSWRYIHYFDGGEELYDIANDPHEWTNLAATPDRVAKLAEMRALAPQEVAPLVWPNVKEGEKK